MASALLGFATAYAARRRVTPASILLPPMVEARSELELQQVGSAACLPHASGGRVALVCGRQRTLAMACRGVVPGPACCPHVAAHICIPTIMPTIRSGLPPAPPQLETSHRCLDLWLWLSFRFPDAWVGGEEVAERRAQLAQLIDASIRSMGLPRWGPMHRQAGPSALMLGQCDQLAAFIAADADRASGQQCSGDSDPFLCCMCREARRQAAAPETPTEEEIAALAAALQHQRQQEEWQQRRSSYRKRRR